MGKRSTYAADVAQEQLKKLAAIQLHVVEQSISANDESVAGADESEKSERQLTDLRHAMHKVESARASSLTRQKLVESIPEFPLPDSSLETGDVKVLRTFYVSQLATLVEAIYSERLIQEAQHLSDEQEYWDSIDSSVVNTVLYLIQTLPLRLAALSKVIAQGVTQAGRAVTSSSREHQSVNARLRHFIGSTPSSVFFSAMFPHLDRTASRKEQLASISGNSLKALQRRATMLGLSPFSLTRQEVAGKRKAIKHSLDERLKRLGDVASTQSKSGTLSTALKKNTVDLTQLERATENTLYDLQAALSEGTSPRQGSAASIINALLSKTLRENEARFDADFARLRRPSSLVRAWPFLLSIPLAGSLVARTVYNSRESISHAYEIARETVRGFVVDWVIEPVRKILDTFRHSDQSLALMGRESLNSDLASLERMTIDFARDQYKMSGPEIDALAEKVRAGDLTVVLKAWENDIKSPLKSTVSGTLLRTLLIQIQKVKVDVDLATNGIEKMLRSQQLTFAFVGVAPSMLILFVVLRSVKNVARGGTPGAAGGAGKRSSRAEKRRCWSMMRTLDSALLTERSSADSDSDSDEEGDGANLRLGRVLLTLNGLREYATGRSFPVKDGRIRDDFLADVRALERAVIHDGASARESDRQNQKKAKAEHRETETVRRLDRLWRWADALGWTKL